MKYQTGRAFRQALERRLRNISTSTSIPLVRLRKRVAFERFLARLLTQNEPDWVLKGGLAVQLRLGNQSRTTMDVDLYSAIASQEIHNELLGAGNIDLGDWFTFTVQEPTIDRDLPLLSQRYPIICRLDSREFERFPIDINTSDVILETAETISFDPILEFAGIKPLQFPCYPIAQQIAEKLHALTRTYQSGESTRAKDLIDILLLAGHTNIEGKKLQKAIQVTFDARATHPLPEGQIKLSPEISANFARISRDLDLKYHDLEEALQALNQFIIPVLENNQPGLWISNRQVWNTK